MRTNPEKQFPSNMKLIRFITPSSSICSFGVIVRDQAVPFAALQKKAGKTFPHLADSRSYLANLPDSERSAKELLAWGEAQKPRNRTDTRVPDQRQSEHA
jgi:hypothetical protein